MPIKVEITIPKPAMQAMVEGIAGVNAVILAELRRRGAPLPPLLYESQIKYRKPGKLTWHTLADLYDLGYGDCKDLVALRCAELRFYEGEPAMAMIVPTRRRNYYHAVVERADGSIEDPSRILIDRERAAR